MATCLHQAAGTSRDDERNNDILEEDERHSYSDDADVDGERENEEEDDNDDEDIDDGNNNESISMKKLNAINGLQSVCEAFAAKIIRVTNE